MNARRAVRVIAFAGVLLGLARPAGAHRLDEYLQAARFSIERNRLDFEIDLTPGASVAATVFSLIDTNRDGRISDGEGQAYAEQVHRAIALSVDGVPLELQFGAGQFPEFAEMNAGTGMIRLHGTAEFSAIPPGTHALFYRNTHQPDISVYLSNALVPADRQVEITAQLRDNAQDELTINYRVLPDSPWPLALLPTIAAVAILFLVSLVFRSRSIGRRRVEEGTASRTLSHRL